MNSGQVISALRVSWSLSSTVELKSLDLVDSADNLAVGENSAIAILTSCCDCSYSNFAIIKSGLLPIDNSIAVFKLSGILKSKLNHLI